MPTQKNLLVLGTITTVLTIAVILGFIARISEQNSVSPTAVSVSLKPHLPEPVTLKPNASGSYVTSTASSTCAHFNTDPATTTVVYANPEMGLTFKLPFNASWGNTEYRVAPYDEIATGITFGPLQNGLDCIWTRPYSLVFTAATSSTAIIQNLKDTASSTHSTPVTTTIHNIPVIAYEIFERCKISTLIALGKKQNYIFTSGCDGGFGAMEEVVKTMVLIE